MAERRSIESVMNEMPARARGLPLKSVGLLTLLVIRGKRVVCIYIGIAPRARARIIRRFCELLLLLPIRSHCIIGVR